MRGDKKNCIAKASIAYRPGAVQPCFPVPLSEVECSKVFVKTATTTWQNELHSNDLTFLLISVGGERRGFTRKKGAAEQCRGTQAV